MDRRCKGRYVMNIEQPIRVYLNHEFAHYDTPNTSCAAFAIEWMRVLFFILNFLYINPASLALLRHFIAVVFQKNKKKRPK